MGKTRYFPVHKQRNQLMTRLEQQAGGSLPGNRRAKQAEPQLWQVGRRRSSRYLFHTSKRRKNNKQSALNKDLLCQWKMRKVMSISAGHHVSLPQLALSAISKVCFPGVSRISLSLCSSPCWAQLLVCIQFIAACHMTVTFQSVLDLRLSLFSDMKKNS